MHYKLRNSYRAGWGGTTRRMAGHIITSHISYSIVVETPSRSSIKRSTRKEKEGDASMLAKRPAPCAAMQQKSQIKQACLHLGTKQ